MVRCGSLKFEDLNHACRGLLVTTAEVLNQSGLRYVIAGGWVPILSEPNHPSLRHPGTRDVDVLMIDELDAVRSAAKELLSAGFRPSAKHEFQLLKNASVGEREFVFNIDLMHPYEADGTPEMFSDIFDLGVNDAYDPKGSRFMKSIAFKSAAIVYEEGLFSNVSVEDYDLGGEYRTVSVPILSPAAAILSKCESVKTPKRTRDAFDIYYILSGNAGAVHAMELKQLSSAFPQVASQMVHLKDFLERSPDKYDANVSMHSGFSVEGAAAKSLALLFN